MGLNECKDSHSLHIHEASLTPLVLVGQSHKPKLVSQLIKVNHAIGSH